VRLEIAATAYLRFRDSGRDAFHRRALEKRKDNAERQSTPRRGKEREKENKEGDVKSPLHSRQLRDDQNLRGLEIPKFGGLRSTQHTDVDAGIFGDQFAGTSASQCRGVDFRG
jgi:hypothetical protein